MVGGASRWGLVSLGVLGVTAIAKRCSVARQVAQVVSSLLRVRWSRRCGVTLRYEAAALLKLAPAPTDLVELAAADDLHFGVALHKA